MYYMSHVLHKNDPIVPRWVIDKVPWAGACKIHGNRQLQCSFLSARALIFSYHLRRWRDLARYHPSVLRIWKSFRLKNPLVCTMRAIFNTLWIVHILLYQLATNKSHWVLLPIKNGNNFSICISLRLEDYRESLSRSLNWHQRPWTRTSPSVQLVWTQLFLHTDGVDSPLTLTPTWEEHMDELFGVVLHKRLT